MCLIFDVCADHEINDTPCFEMDIFFWRAAARDARGDRPRSGCLVRSRGARRAARGRAARGATCHHLGAVTRGRCEHRDRLAAFPRVVVQGIDHTISKIGNGLAVFNRSFNDLVVNVSHVSYISDRVA